MDECDCDDECPTEDQYGKINYDVRRKYAIIYYKNNEHIKDTILHELLHIVMAGYAVFCSSCINSIYQFETHRDHLGFLADVEEEKIIWKLVKIFKGIGE